MQVLCHPWLQEQLFKLIIYLYGLQTPYAYATLTLRSTISIEIIERIQAEEDITLAFPTQSIYLDKDVRKPKLKADIEDEVVV